MSREEDAVHRVVEHHVEPLESRHGRDLRHAEAGRVVDQADITPQLLGDVVQRRPHEPEVLLRGVRAGIPLAGRPLGHEVQQRLPGRPDDGDDVGALAGRGLGLRDVLVDVTGRHEQVDPRPLLRVTVALDQTVACRAVPVDTGHSGFDRAQRETLGGAALAALRKAERHRARCGLLGERQQVGRFSAAQRVEYRCGDAVLEPDLTTNGVDQVVDPRNTLMVGAGQARQPQNGPLDGHGGVRLGDPDHRRPRLAGQRSCLADDGRIELQLGPRLRLWLGVHENAP